MIAKFYSVTLFSAFLSISSLSSADENSFRDGPLIKGYGQHTAVDQNEPVDTSTVFKVAFDVGSQGSSDKVNRSFDSLARFINMHAANGVPAKNLQLALVIHGKAAYDTLSNEAYDERFMQNNPNHELLEKLMDKGVEVTVCGQTAGFFEIEKDELQDGVIMSLSAMTTHALLQQKGYTVNPF